MSIKKIVAKQYRDKVNQAVQRFGGFSMQPPEGWLRTVRMALGMSGPQLAKRLGVTKARVSKAEQDETLGKVTLKTMQTMAEAMGCRFVYTVIPEQEVERVIEQRALRKARDQVQVAATHMALEAQSLSKVQLRSEIDRITAEMVEKMPLDFWNDE